MGAAALTPMALFTRAAGPIFAGLDAAAQAKGEKQRAEINAYIGRTRANQADTDVRLGLEDELSTLRATMAANGQRPGVGTMDIFNELRRTRGRERRVEVGNRMAEAADWKMAAKNAGNEATGSLFGGFIKAGPSIFDIYDYYDKKRRTRLDEINAMGRPR